MMAEALRTNIGEAKPQFLKGFAEHPALKAILAWNAEALTDAKFDRNELTLTIAGGADPGGAWPLCRLPATTSLKT